MYGSCKSISELNIGRFGEIEAASILGAGTLIIGGDKHATYCNGLYLDLSSPHILFLCKLEERGVFCTGNAMRKMERQDGLEEMKERGEVKGGRVESRLNLKVDFGIVY